jgi:hypothetical protein
MKRGYNRQGISNYAHSNVSFASIKRFSRSLVFATSNHIQDNLQGIYIEAGQDKRSLTR